MISSNEIIIVRSLTDSDLGIFAAHRPTTASNQRALNINSQITQRLLSKEALNKDEVYFDCNIVFDKTVLHSKRHFGKVGKNWRLGGKKIEGEIFSLLSSKDFVLIKSKEGNDGSYPLIIVFISRATNNSTYEAINHFVEPTLKDSMEMYKEGSTGFEKLVAFFPEQESSKMDNSESHPSISNMDITFFDKNYDKVVKSVFCSGKTTYEHAIKYFYPQIDAYYAQRKKLDEKFYEKLERDIISGCIMPSITIAIVTDDLQGVKEKSKEQIAELLIEKKNSIYILDGIQRLNTLKNAYNSDIKDLTLYFNLLVTDSDDRLLYRMITLNNGQKPMSARHQIEVLTRNIFDFEDVGLPIQSEKERSKKRIKGSFAKDDIIKSYIAYLSESVNIDNQKIIESKMDELIADKIIESDIIQGDSQFIKVIEKIEEFVDDVDLMTWFKQSNNLIGFCAGIGKSFTIINNANSQSFKENIEKFESAFESFDISKIKLGHLRRITVQHFISKYEILSSLGQKQIEDNLSQASLLFM